MMKKFVRLEEQAVLTQLYNLKQLVFEVTDGCNLKCKYCGYGDLYTGYDARKDKKLQLEDAIAVIDYLVNLWRQYRKKSTDQTVMVSFYGGEPLINMNLIQSVVANLESIQDSPRDFSYSLTTNGMLLDKYIDYLVEKEFHVLISLDGDERGQSYRVDHNGQNSFNRVYDNIVKVKNKYPDYFDRHINFNSVLHDRNSTYITSKFIKNNFGKNPRLSPLNNSGISSEKNEEFHRMYKTTLQGINSKEEFEDLLNEGQELEMPFIHELMMDIFRNSGNVFSNYNDLLLPPPSAQYPTGTCLPFSKKVFVTVNGKILGCERIDHKFAVGQISDGNVNIDIAHAVKMQNRFYEKLEKQCDKCANQEDCPQCVYQIDYTDEMKIICKSFISYNKQNEIRIQRKNILLKYPYLYQKIMDEVVLF